MIYHLFFLILPSILKAFVPPLDGSKHEQRDVQNNLADKGDVLGIESEPHVQYDYNLHNDYSEYKNDVYVVISLLTLS